jgi:uncharacterized phage protein gp47/JayE
VVSADASAAANVAAGTINTMASALSGVDSVSNALALLGGSDQETDASFRERFPAFLAGLAKATKAAIGSAVSAVGVGVRYRLIENKNYDGSFEAGHFYVVVDDGSGAPSDAFLTQVFRAIDAVRPIGTTFGVFAPIRVGVSLSMSISVSDENMTGAIASVQAAMHSYINGLTIGAVLPLSRVVQLAYSASGNVTNVTNVLINGVSQDLYASQHEILRSNIVTVTP